MVNTKGENKMNAKRFLRTALQMFVIVFATVALTNAQPTNFQPHGDNSSGATVASENIDSVTVGSTMRYFVMPDTVANPGYNFTTNPGALVSTFDWWTKSSATIVDSAENDVYIQWAATGSDIIYVTEIGASCNGLDTTTINVTVINKPEAGFDHATYADDICTSTPTSVQYDFPVSLSTDVNSGSLRVHVTAVNTTTSTTIFDGDLDLLETNSQITIGGGGANGTFDDYGVITVTIASVSDRISRKSSVAGTLTSGADVFTYTIVRPPSTGAIYHLPNN